MKKAEIESEIENIYVEMKKWQDENNQLGFEFTEEVVTRREMRLIKLATLRSVSTARRIGDKKREQFHTSIFLLMKNFGV